MRSNIPNLTWRQAALGRNIIRVKFHCTVCFLEQWRPRRTDCGRLKCDATYYCWSRDSAVDIVTTLRAGGPRNYDSILSRDKRFVSPKLPDRLWSRAILIMTGAFPRTKRQGREAKHSPKLGPKLRMSGYIPLFTCMSWWCPLGQFDLLFLSKW